MNTITVALVCPFSTGPTRGNMTTVCRISQHLAQTGCRGTILALDSMLPDAQRILLSQLHPGLLHAFHAYHAGPATRSLARESGIPYLVTITGSDLFDPELRSDPSTRQAIQDAAAVTCFDPLVARHLAEVFPDAAARITVIPQGVAPLPVRAPFPRGQNEFVILMPAAIRPVKGITHAIEALTPLAGRFPSLRLVLAGGDLDPLYASGIRETAAALPWVDMLGEVPHQRMGDLFASSDLVLNCSLFEGGMANTLLEAMIMGKPVLARDIVGNRSLIRHGETGWLYQSDEQLRELVRLILHNPELGSAAGEAGRKLVQERCSITAEVRSYRELYERILAGSSTEPVGTIKTA